MKASSPEIVWLTRLVFLGKEIAPGDGDYYVPNYPIPKMADFGLSRLTRLTHENNKIAYFQQGTKPYFPPVSFTSKINWNADD